MSAMEVADDVQRLVTALRALSPGQRARWFELYGSSLNAWDLACIERVLGEHERAGWRADPWTMARHLEGPEVVEDWAVARYTAGVFREAVTGEGPRFVVINQPAQTGKTLGLRRDLVWALDHDPKLPIIFLSYGDVLARESAMWVRDIAQAHADELSFQLKPDLRRQGRWATTQGGGMLATGIAGGAAGYPAGGVIVDDPLKNWQQAHSEITRDAVWNEIVAVARLRLREGGWFVLAHTRWHEDDPTGRFMKLADELGIELRHVKLPMIAVENDPLGRAPGEVLEPKRYSITEARSRADFLGSYLAAALEQQDPQPEEGGEVKRAWWKWMSAPPEPDHADAWLSSTDTKLRDSGTGDYVVTQVWCRIGASFVCVDQLRGQWTLLGTKVALALISVRHPHVHRHVVENAGNGPEVMQQLGKPDPSFVLTDELIEQVGVTEHERDAVEDMIRRGMPGLVPQNVKENKLVRTRAVAPFIESGHVYLIENKRWANTLVDEAASFPKGAHDDQVDAMTQAISRLRLMEADTNVAPPATRLPAAQSARTISTGTSGLIRHRIGR